MFELFLRSTGKYLLALPGVIATIYGLQQAAMTSGLDKSRPDLYAKLSSLNNGLLEFLLEEWIGYIIFCVLLGFIWTLIVGEPKKRAKRKYSETLSKRLRKPR